MNTRAYGVAALAGFVGGNVSSFIKWGTEIPFPPRTPDRPVPPVEMLDSLGINAQQLTYVYSEHVVNYGSALVHHGFSIFFAMFYCLLVLRYPRTALWQGSGFRPVDDPGVSRRHPASVSLGTAAVGAARVGLLSETFGHLLWMWVIEVIRRDLQQRWLPHTRPA